MADSKQGNLTPTELMFSTITVGTVVDTNDPSQSGRLRVMCPAFNDQIDSKVKDIPWALYASPFAGDTQRGTSGSGDDERVGPVAYGMWAIPKVGAQAIVMCIDGNPQQRVWMGCLFGQFASHTMPHGRFSYNDDAKKAGEQRPFGPMDSQEGAINPLHKNTQTAFPDPEIGPVNHEYETRGADFQAGSVSQEQLSDTFTSLKDDQDEPIPSGGNLSEMRQGYQLNRQDPSRKVENNLTDANYDNMVTAIVSPGFHAMSMDDRAENSRMRFRTISGHQIIMDDTNERIYVATAKGNNWIEMDQEGNIDIYTSGKMSVHAKKDINFATEGSFRVSAKRGIHLKSDKEIRLGAAEDVSVRSDQNIRIEAQVGLLAQTFSENINFKSGGKFNIQSAANMNVVSGDRFNISSTADTSFDVGNDFIVDAGGSGNIKSSQRLLLQGSLIHFNGPSPAPALDVAEADPAVAIAAFFPNRKPEHEPWARVSSEDETGEPKFTYDSPEVGVKDFATGDDGKSSEEIEFTRGPLWRR